MKHVIKIMKKILDLFMKFLIAFSIILALLAIIKPELIKDFIEWMREIIYLMWNYNYIIIFITSLIESFPVLWVVVPGQNILLIVWWFFSNIDVKNLYYVIIIASIWAILSNYIWYLLWKYYWDLFFKKYWLWFWIWQTEAKYLKSWIKKWWAWWIILWKFHNLTRAFVPFIAGSMWMKHRTFIIYNIIWSIIRATTIVILWVLFAEFYETIIDYFWYIMIWIMIITWLYIWKYKKKEFMKYMEEKNKEIEEMNK